MAINSISSTLSYWLNKNEESTKTSTSTSSLETLLENLGGSQSADSVSISYSDNSSDAQDAYEQLLEERTDLLNQKYELLQSDEVDEETVLDLTEKITLLNEQLNEYLSENADLNLSSYNYSSLSIQSLQKSIYYQNQFKLTQAIETANTREAEMLEKQLEDQAGSENTII